MLQIYLFITIFLIFVLFLTLQHFANISSFLKFLTMIELEGSNYTFEVTKTS